MPTRHQINSVNLVVLWCKLINLQRCCHCQEFLPSPRPGHAWPIWDSVGRLCGHSACIQVTHTDCDAARVDCHSVM